MDVLLAATAHPHGLGVLRSRDHDPIAERSELDPASGSVATPGGLA